MQIADASTLFADHTWMVIGACFCARLFFWSWSRAHLAKWKDHCLDALIYLYVFVGTKVAVCLGTGQKRSLMESCRVYHSKIHILFEGRLHLGINFHLCFCTSAARPDEQMTAHALGMDALLQTIIHMSALAGIRTLVRRNDNDDD